MELVHVYAHQHYAICTNELCSCPVPGDDDDDNNPHHPFWYHALTLPSFLFGIDV